jgi:vancomycin resistance protein VanJ
MAATFQQKIARRFIALTVLLTIATLLAALASLHWFLELFTHFTPWYAVGALMFALTLALLRAWRWAALAFVLAVWNTYPIANLLLQENPTTPTSATNRFTVFHFNANFENINPRTIVSHVRRSKDIDVVVLLETGDSFDAVLADLKDLYPYQIKHLQDSPFGIALASRLPIDHGVISREASRFHPHIEAMLKLPGRAAPLVLYAIHAPPPVSGEMADWRNGMFDFVARKVATQAALTPVVVGDFNLTPWSPHFQRFIANSGLRDARTPHRIDNTWPVTFNNATLGLAIDHTFANPSLPLVKRVIGPDLGSDHLPVTVTFAY